MNSFKADYNTMQPTFNATFFSIYKQADHWNIPQHPVNQVNKTFVCNNIQDPNKVDIYTALASKREYTW